MKTLLAAATLILAGLWPAAAQHGHQHPAPGGHHDAAPRAGEVVKRGEPLGDAPAVKFADVFKEPRKYAGKRVRIEGVVERVCQKEGCWMQIAPEAGAAESVRVTFDHKFSVPKDSSGVKFRAEGVFAVKNLTAEQASHLEEDGARLRRDKDGEATELTFAAAGVELWK